MSVFQEQSFLLYLIAGLLVVLIVIGVGIWMRLGEMRDAIAKPPPPVRTGAWRDKPVTTAAARTPTAEPLSAADAAARKARSDAPGRTPTP